MLALPGLVGTPGPSFTVLAQGSVHTMHGGLETLTGHEETQSIRDVFSAQRPSLSLKIAMLVYEPAFSGESVHVARLATGLAATGGMMPAMTAVQVVFRRGDDEMARRLQQAGVAGVPVEMGRLGPTSLAGLRRLVSFLSGWRPDILHVHGHFAGLWSRPLARLIKVRNLVYTPHTVQVQRGGVPRAIYQSAERQWGHMTHRLIALNAAQAEFVIAHRWLLRERIRVIPNGVVLSEPLTTAQIGAVKRSLGMNAEAPLVLQVGRLAAQKDPLTFVRAATQVASQQPLAHFALIGEGPLRNEVIAAVQASGIQGRFHVLGWRRDAVRVMQAASVVTLTSRWEGMSYALLEAMIAARPVVATDIPGNAELVSAGQGPNHLYPARDAAGLARAILQLLADPVSAQRQAAHGQDYVQAHYSEEHMIAKTAAVYAELL